MTFADAAGAVLVLLPIAAYGALIVATRLWRTPRLAAAIVGAGLAGSGVAATQSLGPSLETVRLAGAWAFCLWVFAALALAYEISHAAGRRRG